MTEFMKSGSEPVFDLRIYQRLSLLSRNLRQNDDTAVISSNVREVLRKRNILMNLTNN